MAGELKVIVDNRERNSELLAQLEAHGLEVSISTLPVGDYVISDRVCIERKTVSDFESSIVTGRLFEQAQRLKQAYERPILILEGDKSEFRMKGAVISGTIAAFYIDYDIIVLETQDPAQTAEMIKLIAKHEQEGKSHTPSVKGGGRAFTQTQFMERIVGNLPGIGLETAKRLLLHFGSVHAITSASEKDLLKVENVGPKRARIIFETLHSSYLGGIETKKTDGIDALF